MIWLSWRQFRAQAVIAATALAALAVLFGVTSVTVASMSSSTGIAACHAHCALVAANFLTAVSNGVAGSIFNAAIVVLYAAPALIGTFWGAPLITRELETGTFRLAWNQSVPRARWLAAKLGLIGLAAMVTAGLLSLMTSWWASPLYQAARRAGQDSLSVNKLAPPLFGATGIAPLGYAAFAFALGVTAGVLIRKTLPAMAITLAIFAAVQILMPTLVRPHLIPPVHATEALGSVTFNGISETGNGRLFLTIGSINGGAGDWVTSSRAVNAAGQPATRAPAVCQQANSFLQCLTTGSGWRSAISPPAGTGHCSGWKPGSSYSSPPALACSVTGGSAALLDLRWPRKRLPRLMPPGPATAPAGRCRRWCPCATAARSQSGRPAIPAV